jgi:hypothetical protein
MWKIANQEKLSYLLVEPTTKASPFPSPSHTAQPTQAATPQTTARQPYEDEYRAVRYRSEQYNGTETNIEIAAMPTKNDVQTEFWEGE